MLIRKLFCGFFNNLGDFKIGDSLKKQFTGSKKKTQEGSFCGTNHFVADQREKENSGCLLLPSAFDENEKSSRTGGL